MKRLNLSRRFADLRIRYKLLISYSLVLLLSLTIGSGIIFFFVKQAIQTNIESELTNITQTILNMVRTSASVSIKNHLRAVAEKNREIALHFYNRALAGEISMAAVQQQTREVMLSQTIGKTGYIYCIDSQGIILIHPEKALIRVDLSEHAFIAEQKARKVGYLEYNWKNPGETHTRPKALYMTYFEPWDWIVSVSSYRSEFMSLVNVEDFEKSVLEMRFGETGYSFVIDGSGKAIIHPKIQGVNILESDDLPNQYLIQMQHEKSGKISYPWKNPDESKARYKLVMFDHIPEFDWIVGACSYLDEFYAPLRTIRTMILATAVLTFLLLLPISFKISSSITRPLKNLIHHFNRMMTGDFSSRMVPASEDEMGQLALYYNRFADRIETYRNDLEKQMGQRRQVEEALKESEARYRSVMEAAPDPIVVYDMQGLVTYFNPAFTKIFGWALESCLGHKMDHFVPEENWEETHRMIATMIAGETLSSVPTRRFTKSGRIVDVSISGATFRNRRGELEGSVIILRDVTLSQQLQQQVMDIGDQVRRRIGQDLHDDLCPHLIGIHGLNTVLAENLRECASPDVPLARKVLDLMESATEKARSLSRGLCPVHLVAHGLNAALEDVARQTETVFAIDCPFKGDDQVVVADNTVATHLYYIAQEAIQNAVKHAEADRIEIHLLREDGRIHLKVVDNGKGLPKEMKSGGIGLQIMQYRAKIIQATFRIDSNSETGTAIDVFLKTAPFVSEGL